MTVCSKCKNFRAYIIKMERQGHGKLTGISTQGIRLPFFSLFPGYPYLCPPCHQRKLAAGLLCARHHAWTQNNERWHCALPGVTCSRDGVQKGTSLPGGGHRVMLMAEHSNWCSLFSNIWTVVGRFLPSSSFVVFKPRTPGSTDSIDQEKASKISQTICPNKLEFDNPPEK